MSTVMGNENKFRSHRILQLHEVKIIKRKNGREK